eukprot:6991-Heterococcus_DN1.PRE.5
MARHHCRRSTAQGNCAAAQERATELAAQLTGVTTARAELQLQLDTAIAERSTAQESATELAVQLGVVTAGSAELQQQLAQRTAEKDNALATATTQSEQLSIKTADLLVVQQQLDSATADTARMHTAYCTLMHNRKSAVADELATQTVETATLNTEKSELLQQLEALKAEKDVAVAAAAAKDEQLAVTTTAYNFLEQKLLITSQESVGKGLCCSIRLWCHVVHTCALLLLLLHHWKDAADGKVAEHAGLMAAIDTEMAALRQQVQALSAEKDSSITTVSTQAAELLQVRSDSTALQQQLDDTRTDLALSAHQQELDSGCVAIAVYTACSYTLCTACHTAQHTNTHMPLKTLTAAKESTAVTINELRSSLAQATTTADQLPAVQLALSALQEEMAALTVQHTAVVQIAPTITLKALKSINLCRSCIDADDFDTVVCRNLTVLDQKTAALDASAVRLERIKADIVCSAEASNDFDISTQLPVKALILTAQHHTATATELTNVRKTTSLNTSALEKALAEKTEQ